MKADAYLYASGGRDGKGHYSREIDMLTKIDRFGLEAITGRRQFYYGELQRIIVAENIVAAYRSSKAAENLVKWTEDNERLSELLNDAMKAANLGQNQ